MTQLKEGVTQNRLRNKFWKEYHRLFSRNLPEGFFDGQNIATYRKLAKTIPINGVLVEFGSWKGRSICSIAGIIKRKKLNVYCVDTFLGTVNEGNEELIKEAAKKDIYQEFVNNINTVGLGDYVKIIRQKTTDAIPFMPEFDFIFIDADHSYEAVKQDIKNVLPKIKPHGIIAGHDYTSPPVKKAVDEMFVALDGLEDNVWWKRNPDAC